MRKYTSKDPYTLFDISDEMKQIIADMTEAQAEKDLELVNALTTELIEMIEMHGNKYEATVHVIKNSLAAAEYNKAIADEFQSIATAHNKLAKTLKERLHEDMKFHHLDEVNAGIYVVRTATNPTAKLEVYVDADKLPEQFQKIEVDTDELRYALSVGEEVEGAELVKGQHIRISANRKRR